MAYHTIPTARPFRVVANPDNRSDGYTTVLTADTATVSVALPAFAASQANYLDLEYTFVFAATSGLVFLNPNGDTGATGNFEHHQWTVPGTAPARGNSTRMFLGVSNDPAGVRVAGTCTLDLKDPALRSFFMTSRAYTTTPEIKSEANGFSTYLTALTSFTVTNGNLTNFKSGSRITAVLRG